MSVAVCNMKNADPEKRLTAGPRVEFRRAKIPLKRGNAATRGMIRAMPLAASQKGTR